MNECGGVVLCGGQSSRMGLPKATLPFGPEVLLQRVVRLLSQAVQPIVVVAAPGQALPDLPDDVDIVRDEHESRGPMEGLRVGLSALRGRCRRAYATSCDVPLLKPDFVRRVAALAEEGSEAAAVPRTEGYFHPLAAVYAIEVVIEIDRLLAADQRRLASLFDRVPTRVIEAAELLDVDPSLDSLKNMNQPADYLAALAAAGFPGRPEGLSGLKL